MGSSSAGRQNSNSAWRCEYHAAHRCCNATQPVDGCHRRVKHAATAETLGVAGQRQELRGQLRRLLPALFGKTVYGYTAKALPDMDIREFKKKLMNEYKAMVARTPSVGSARL